MSEHKMCENVNNIQSVNKYKRLRRLFSNKEPENTFNQINKEHCVWITDKYV